MSILVGAAAAAAASIKSSGEPLFTTLSSDLEVTTASSSVTATALNAPGGSGDFIGVYNVTEANNANWLSRQLVSAGQGTKQWTATMPAGAGDYHFRYCTSANARLARSQTITVVTGNIRTVGGTSPFYATPSAAATGMASNDLGLIRNGTYSGFSSNTSNRTFRAENRHGVVISGTNTVVSGTGTGTKLKGMTIRGGGAAGQAGQFSGLINIISNWVLEDCIVEDADEGREGIRSATGGGVVANNYRIERTIIQDNGGNGIWGRPGTTTPADHDGATIKDTIFRRNNLSEYDPGFFNGANKLMYTNNLLIDGVISYDNFGNGLWLDFGSTNYTVRNCTLFANHGNGTWANGGFFDEANPGPGLVEDNVCYSNVEHGMILAESQNITVQDNLLVDQTNGWILRASNGGRTPPTSIDFINNVTDGASPTTPGSDITETGTTTPGTFAGPLHSVTQTSTYDPQVTTAPETSTIDAAITAASAVVGDNVTIPCYGRKAIVTDGSSWATEVFDLMCRYVKVTIPTQALRDALEAGVPQYANTQGRNATIRLSVKSTNGYDVEGQLVSVP